MNGLTKSTQLCSIPYKMYRILLIKRTCPNKRTGPIFHSPRGNDQRKCYEKLVKLPPRRCKKSKIIYLSSCWVCKPTLNSAISAVPSCSHCPYSPHDRTIEQLTIFPHAGLQLQTSKLTEQRERKGAITVCNIEVCFQCCERKNLPIHQVLSQLHNGHILKFKAHCFLHFFMIKNHSLFFCSRTQGFCLFDKVFFLSYYDLM